MMDRPKERAFPMPWIEYADWLEAERDKLREAFMQSSEDHADTGKYALGLRKKLVERDEENAKLRKAAQAVDKARDKLASHPYSCHGGDYTNDVLEDARAHKALKEALENK
jgi:hypothetical protein